VSDHARARIEAAIEELGYRRDGVARYLKTGKTDSIGLVLPEIGLPYFAEVTRELNACAFEHGHQLLIATSEFDLAREETHLESLAERRVDGIILMSIDPDRDMSLLEQLGTPVVVVDRPEFAVESARAATEHLIADGHKRVGFVGTGPISASRRRLNGWSIAYDDSGLEHNAGWVVTAPPTRAGGYSAARQAMGGKDRASAFVVESDAQASGFIRAVKDLGLRIPEDVALVSLEGTDLGQFSVPSLTSVVQPVHDIAQDAIRTVLLKDAGPVRRVNNVGFELALRESCGH
jgi:LacI family transcriptional regulator